MRKQTKKVLSWVLAGAMALSLIPSVGLVSEKADAAVSTVDKVVFDKAVESKLVGGDSGEARLLVFNNWGKYDPSELEGIDVKNASITFKVAGVADVLAKTGAKSIKAFLGLNSSDWSVNTLGNTVPANGVTEIEKDGTYTVTYTGSSTVKLGNQMGVMFADIDSALEKDDDKNVTAGLTISDVTMKTTELKFADDTEGPEVTPTPEPTPTPAPAPEPTPAPEPAKNLCPYTLYQVMDLGDGYKGYYAPRYGEYADWNAMGACESQLAGYILVEEIEVGTYDDTSTVLLEKFAPYEG